ncbi:cytochrome c oxidase polypeptide 5, mitochondrial-like [Teratosphaeria destructans]|uniref:Cytochrome c oxidase polypeptide V n=1 Tax=Teratosphaeria destructans TaxID=418781 RepID=A0A9W7T1T8_9PEZI|nr:cytochrome c oxidase polypeptide 5, mitochondrial-like [Teratosphaeria destructans]
MQRVGTSLARARRSAGAPGSAARRVGQMVQVRREHAISNPTLANIEKRWEAMPPQEQADLWMALRDRMKVDWNQMTLQEKKADGILTPRLAAYWIAFGPHGPRALPPPGENAKIFLYTMYGVIASGVIFGIIKFFARAPPRTMTKEYQEASNVYLKESNVEPITGVSSEGYVGPGMVQSAPGPKGAKSDE